MEPALHSNPRASAMPPKSLSSRPLDLALYVFYLIHIPITLLIDGQFIFGELYPSQLRGVVEWWAVTVGDPFYRPCVEGRLPWFASYVWAEVFLELPVFFLILDALRRDSRSHDPIILLYVGHVLTTTSSILFELWFGVGRAAKLEQWQMAAVSAAYVPFFLFPAMLGSRILGRKAVDGGGIGGSAGGKKKQK